MIQIIHPFETVAQYSPPTNGLVGWWQGDGNANDSSGKGHNGTLLNGATFGTGLFGQAFSIGPGFNRVYVPDSTDFNITNSLSIGAWIYPTAESWHVLERGGNQSGSNPYGMGLDDAGHFEFYINNGTADLVMAPISFNQWIQVTATLDGTTGDMRLYFNGVVVAEKTTSLSPFALTNPSLQPALGIGNTPDVGGFPFIGLIEEVVLYSRTLSPAEVAILTTGTTNLPPAITVEPQGQSVYSGTAVTLAVTASGSPPLNYLWYNDGLPMLSATNSSLVFSNIAVSDQGNYAVVVSNPFGVLVSSNAQISVTELMSSIGLYPGISVTGIVGSTVAIQYTTNLNPSATWVTLTNLPLTQSNALWFDTGADVNSTTARQRFYRVLPGP